MTTPLDWILLFIVFAVVVVIGFRILTMQWSGEERLGEGEDGIQPDDSGETEREK